MDDKLYWDPDAQKFVIASQLPSHNCVGLLNDVSMPHPDGPCPGYVDPDQLIGLIIKHNRDIQQGWTNDLPIEFDEGLFRDAIERYNDMVNQKFIDNMKNQNN